ncbi:UNVERIFIED_CONTAM: hypothetical protein RMT77_008002 [Armadillidium vulgare]
MAWKFSRYEPYRGFMVYSKNEIHKVPLATKHALIERLIYVWFHNDKIKNFCRTLITDMQKRVKELKTAKGRQTKY